MSRKAATLALAAVLLSGCDSNRDSTYGQVLSLMKTGVAGTFSTIKVSREQAAAIPYASMGWRLDGGNQSLIVLATDTGGDQMWTSSARIVLVTRDGRLMRSVGLPHNLGGTTPGNEPFPSPAMALRGSFRSSRTVDYPDTGHYGVLVTCQSRTAGRETITILDHGLITSRVDESCYSPTLRWHFTNHFWVDPQDGTVWRTRQYFHPQEGVLETELLRPPG